LDSDRFVYTESLVPIATNESMAYRKGWASGISEKVRILLHCV